MADDTVTDSPLSPVPRHVAIIMDGNGRWARQHRVSVSAGHRAGVEAVRGVLRACTDHGVQVVTLFAFSSENWQRPALEVKALMTLFASYLKSEIDQLDRDGVQVRFIGDRSRFSKKLLQQMDAAESRTAANRSTILVIAVDYGGQWDIARACQQLAEQVRDGSLEPAAITPELIGQHVALADLPLPDLCVRTSGEQRISNFLLWQLAYAELYFTATLWPDFGEADMRAALVDFSRRQRRFGCREDEWLEQSGSA